MDIIITEKASRFIPTVFTNVTNSVAGEANFDLGNVRINLVSVAAQENILGESGRRILGKQYTKEYI